MSGSYSDDSLRKIIAGTKVLALVGASDNPARPSYGVGKYLMDKGFIVYPVNPNLAGKKFHGQEVFASLSDIPHSFTLVDVFRKPEALGPLVEEILAIREEKGITTLWTQLGITNEEAAEKARKAGLVVVMNRCLKIETKRLGF